jgi:hypothetical protein
MQYVARFTPNPGEDWDDEYEDNPYFAPEAMQYVARFTPNPARKKRKKHRSLKRFEKLASSIEGHLERLEHPPTYDLPEGVVVSFTPDMKVGQELWLKAVPYLPAKRGSLLEGLQARWEAQPAHYTRKATIDELKEALRVLEDMPPHRKKILLGGNPFRAEEDLRNFIQHREIGHSHPWKFEKNPYFAPEAMQYVARFTPNPGRRQPFRPRRHESISDKIHRLKNRAVTGDREAVRQLHAWVRRLGGDPEAERLRAWLKRMTSSNPYEVYENVHLPWESEGSKRKKRRATKKAAKPKQSHLFESSAELYEDDPRLKGEMKRIAKAKFNVKLKSKTLNSMLDVTPAELRARKKPNLARIKELALAKVAGMPFYKGVPIEVLPPTSKALWHKVRVAEPELFKAHYGGRGIYTKEFSKDKGIRARLGVLKEKGKRGGTTQIQSYLFDADMYTVEDAIDWVLDESEYEPIMAVKAPPDPEERRPKKIRKRKPKKKPRIPKIAKKKAKKKKAKKKRKRAG